MLSTKQKNDMLNLFNSLNKNEEYEVMFNNYRRDNKLSIVNFMNVLKYATWRSKEDKLKMSNNVSLDIIYDYDINSVYRVSINGLEDINSFLNLVHQRKNHVIFSILMTQYLKKDNVSLIKKEKDKKHIFDFDEYDIRVRKSKELDVDNKTINDLANLPISQSEKIFYRFKQRVNVKLNEKENLNMDLTIINFSNNINTLKSSNKLYELELDYFPTKKKNSKILKTIISEIENVKKVLEGSSDLLSNKQKKEIISEYKKIVYGSANTDFKNLYSMQPISAEVQHIIDKVPNKYSATDKADGEKYCLFVHNEEVYYLSNNLDVKKSGIKVKNFNNTILEGEMIPLYEKRKYLYMIFDCIFFKNKDMRKESILKNRLSKANEFCKEVTKNVFELKEYNQKFNLDKMRDHFDSEIKRFYKNLNENIDKMKKNDIFIHPKLFLFPTGGNDSEVFLYSELIWHNCTEDESVNCPYYLDGIIYTGLDQKYTRDKREQKLPIYKYKPPEHNSIDVYIKYEMNEETGNKLEIFDNSIPNSIENKNFRVLNFYVGDFIGNKEIPTPFMKDDNNHQGFFPIERGEVRDVEGNVIQDDTVIEIVYNNNEDIPHQYRWSILRTRWDKTESIRRDGRKYGNFKDVAIKTWKSMTEAVTIDEIRNLANPDTYTSQRNTLSSRIDSSIVISDRKQDLHYQKILNLCREMKEFHNWIKSIIIYTYCSPEYFTNENKLRKKDVLDIGCGRGEDIMKFYHSRVKKYVGIDIDYEGINSSIDGAISRYNNLKSKFPDFVNSVFIQADGSLNLNTKSQSQRFSNSSDENMVKIKDNFEKSNKYDIFNAMFSFNYLVQNKDSINNLIKNIDNLLLNNGYFLLTVFDTSKVESLLKNKDVYTSFYTDDNGSREKLFEIKKSNKKNDLCEIKKGIKKCFPIEIHRSWVDQENKYTTEYLPTNESIIEVMDKAKCKLVDTDLFENIYHMNKYYFDEVIEYEENEKNKKFYSKVAKFYSDLQGASKNSREWSFLFRFYVFKKID